MSNGVQAIGNGNFQVNGQTFDYATLVLSLQLERVNLLDQQLAGQAQEIADRNAAIAKANDMLALAQAAKNNAAAANGSVGTDPELTKFLKGNNIPFDQKDSNGFVIGNKDQWDVTIQKIKNFTDKLNSQSELDFLRVQNLTNKREQAIELSTNTLQKDSKVKNDVIANTR